MSMATVRQQKAARRNIRKLQARRRSMTKRQHSIAQPQGRSRRRPGAGGDGNYYRVEVRPHGKYVAYRLQDVGRSGHTKRLAGRTAKGNWSTKSWLVHKSDAYVKDGKLILTGAKAASLLKNLRGMIRHLKGDIFVAKPRRNIPETSKPTVRQRRAYRRNIKKAQRARWR
jgi:hypothetical protein